jgi:hypothetical protein
MNAKNGIDKLYQARRAVSVLLDRMEQSNDPRYRGLIVRGRMLLSNLDYQIDNLRATTAQNNGELGFPPLALWLAPAAWAAGAVALTAVSKWVSDAWSASSAAKTESLKVYQADIVRFGPERAAQMARERTAGAAGSIMDKIIWLALIAVGGFLLMRMIR